MKPALVLALFLFNVIANAVLADAHSLDGQHGGNDSAHVHLSGHDHGASESDDTAELSDHSDHEDAHIHLCFHFLPWGPAVEIYAQPTSTDYSFRQLDYLELIYTPPVPPPTV